MFFIKPCPRCGRNLRFPLDKGTIRVKCVCGGAFTVNPDDPAVYRNGSFDLRHRSQKHRGFFSRIDELREKTLVHDLPSAVIKKIMRAKYTLQNFSLLPAGQQRTIIAVVVLLLAVILLAVWFIAGAKPRELPHNGITL